MRCVFSAERTILVELHPVGVGLLVLGAVVIAALALGAGQGDLRTHDSPPDFFLSGISLVGRAPRARIHKNLRTKKRDFSLAKTIYHTP